ncbi:MotA/TolQ/ExbB proton channel family protein [Teredinibacter turnerae]|uniref:MotA/TolQ/ExbB proton channel family protein n=1 Tax=Teredinibacter turnerae TaxID=2426 RepID=UPI001E39C2AF|nr:MotA/TolQ/ExbB proton channel family protein [Teredinibacter turnerae]
MRLIYVFGAFLVRFGMQALVEFLVLGGLVVQVLLVFSVVSVAIILVKLWQAFQYRPAANAHPEQVLGHFEKGEWQQALLLSKNQRNARALVMASALNAFDQGSLGEADVRAEVGRVARNAIEEQQRYLRVLEVVAMVAPLLGLFGTVLGMISAFQAMENAGAQVNPSVLSAGIWKALMTTAVGLAVAIPVSIAHSWLERRVENLAHHISDDVQRLFTAFHQRNAQPVAKKQA